MPATPVLSNGGTERGLPISCFLNEAGDSLEGILGLWSENVWLAAKGGGIGSYWGNLRSIDIPPSPDEDYIQRMGRLFQRNRMCYFYAFSLQTTKSGMLACKRQPNYQPRIQRVSSWVPAPKHCTR